MKDLEKEAENYANSARMIDLVYANGLYYGYVAGATSNWAQENKIKSQIEVLKSHIEHPTKPGYKRSDVVESIKELKKKLKALQNERKTR
jgi:hypothetical protein